MIARHGNHAIQRIVVVANDWSSIVGDVPRAINLFAAQQHRTAIPPSLKDWHRLAIVPLDELSSVLVNYFYPL